MGAAWDRAEDIFTGSGLDVFMGVSEFYLTVEQRPHAEYATLFQGGNPVDARYGISSGFSPYDLMFFEALSTVFGPRRVFLHSDDFGWNALCLASLFAEAEICLFGSESQTQNHRSFQEFICQNLQESGQRCRVVTDPSGRGSDTDPLPDLIVWTDYGAPEDLEAEISRIVDAYDDLPVLVFWNLGKDTALWRALHPAASKWPGEAREVTRCSGLGAVLCPKNPDPELAAVLASFFEPSIYNLAWQPQENGQTYPSLPVFKRLISLYNQLGHEVMVGLRNIYSPDVKDRYLATLLVKNGEQFEYHQSGQGIALLELYFFECLSRVIAPKNIFVVGNAFGWSTLALALIFPDARIVALDNLSSGADSRLGHEVTLKIAEANGLNVTVVEGASPHDVDAVAREHLDGPVDFAFIDGLHTVQQQELDFEAIKAVAAPDCVYVFHDVLMTKMLAGFLELKNRWPGGGDVMTRTPSGIGCLYPDSKADTVGRVVRSFSEPGIRVG
jgi:predicted O-methyltransferase YrrM